MPELQQLVFPERAADQLEAHRHAVVEKATGQGQSGQPEVVDGPQEPCQVAQQRVQGRSVLDVGGQDVGRGHRHHRRVQHVDPGKNRFGERGQGWSPVPQCIQVLRRGNGIPPLDPYADLAGVQVPLAAQHRCVLRGCFCGGDEDACRVRCRHVARVHRHQDAPEPAQHVQAGLHAQVDRGVHALREIAGRDPHPQAPHGVAYMPQVVGHGGATGCGVPGVVSGNRLQHHRAVVGAARQGTYGVERERQRHGGCAAHPSITCLQAGDAVHRCWQADGCARVRTQGGKTGACRHSGSRAAGGSSRDACRIPRVSAVADGPVVPGRAEREFSHVQHPELHRTGRVELAQHRRGGLRQRLADPGATVARNTCAVEHVLVRHGDAFEGTACRTGGAGVVTVRCE